MPAKTGKMPDFRKRWKYEYARVFRIGPTDDGYDPAEADKGYPVCWAPHYGASAHRAAGQSRSMCPCSMRSANA